MANEKLKKKRPSMRVVLKEFSQNTTAHGISQIHISDNWFWRILWVLACGAGAGMVIWQSTTLIINYMKLPQKTTIDVAYSQTVNFPMVTVCNLNSIKVSRLKFFPKVQEMLKKYDAVQNSNKSMKASEFTGSSGGMERAMKKSIMRESGGKQEGSTMDNVEIDGSEYVKDNILNLLAGENREKLTLAGHSFKELIFRCSWNGFTCNEGDFNQYWRRTWNWRYGNCYTFNAGANDNGSSLPVMSITKPGPLFGLTLDLFINQNEYFGLLSQEAGAKILLTDQNQIPFPTTQGFTVAPGSSSSVGVRKSIIERIDPHENGSCYAADEPESDSIYKDMKGVRYSVQGCMNSCLANKQRTTCNCTEGKYRSSKEENICMDEKQVECKIDVIKAYSNNTLGCTEKCPQACMHSSYRVSVSTAEWSESYEKDFQRKITKSDRGFDSKMGKDRSVMKKNFLRVKIYFEELNLQKITYAKSYEMEDLLSDIGGQLGLWIGISALTIVEIIKLLLDLANCVLKKLVWVNQQRDVGVDNIQM